MSDIVERLREIADRADANYPAIMEQAADLITALRAENERLRVEAAGEYADGLHNGRDKAGDEWEQEVAALRAENERLRAVLKKADEELAANGYRDTQWPRPDIRAALGGHHD